MKVWGGGDPIAGRQTGRVVAAVLGLALTAVIATASPALGTPAKGRGLVLSTFKLKGANGYAVEVDEVQGGNLPPTAAITAKRDALQVKYEVPAELESGIHALFGSVGTVAVDFQRRTRSVERPEKGCAWITETGTFRGQFSFAGEGGYTAAEATALPGQIVRLPDGFCGFGSDRKSGLLPSFLRTTQLVARARSPHGSLEFGASTLGGVRFGFSASLRENVGAMTITRSAFASGAASSFVIGPGKRPRYADVRPPPPFEGVARFRDPAGGPATWAGPLSVSLPGAPAAALAGPDFSSRLCRNHYPLQKCKVPLPPR
jgi:hypothetical protein